ncbi:hypothetical protein KAR26_03910 [Candidatus Parcubacteria bacterium]|nr:hypothetical protein [Candidatus Parcubacteria bacterium]
MKILKADILWVAHMAERDDKKIINNALKEWQRNREKTIHGMQILHEKKRHPARKREWYFVLWVTYYEED